MCFENHRVVEGVGIVSVLLIDNYDSFVHNLARSLREVGATCTVVRNDAVSLEEIEALHPEHIVVSPGPRGPEQAGVSLPLFLRFHTTVPLLGVCLGHQCLAAAFGGQVVRTPPVHGRTSVVTHSGAGVFRGLAERLTVTRYHSLAVADDSLPPELEVTARSDDGIIMGLAHRAYPVVGVQFHPEAVLTEGGHQLLKNFLSGVR